MKERLIALQVYSVRDAAEADFAGTMRKVKEMGYDGVELAGTYGMTAVEAKKILDEVGLELVSAHVPMDQLEDDAVLDDYAATGLKHIAIPWLTGPKTKEELDAAIARIRSVGERCKARGMQLLYHNHDFEFEKIDGRYILDAYYAEIPSGVLGQRRRREAPRVCPQIQRQGPHRAPEGFLGPEEREHVRPDRHRWEEGGGFRQVRVPPRGLWPPGRALHHRRR